MRGKKEVQNGGFGQVAGPGGEFDRSVVVTMATMMLQITRGRLRWTRESEESAPGSVYHVLR